MFAVCGKPAVRGTRSASFQSFRRNGNFEELDWAALGAVAVFCRKRPVPAWGRLASTGGSMESIFVLAGYEGNMVQSLPISNKQLIGYWWSASISRPSIGKIAVSPERWAKITDVT